MPDLQGQGKLEQEAPIQIQRIVAFDFGTQKTGAAFGQSMTGTGTPLSLIPMKDGIPDWVLLDKVLAEWQPDICLVGLPLNMDDSESELCLRARKFARRVKHRLNKPVWMVDERLTTREAREDVRRVSNQRKGKAPAADSMAAVLLIESWFREPVGVLP
ncbi:Holliday junction resolvase RuvX [Aquirhabdus sp.]|uniref:Holliday junction resolvase RuvX n=1 Tax=Aquirhabdus sp. TaxID=2824160 RepID=UPI00396C541B